MGRTSFVDVSEGSGRPRREKVQGSAGSSSLLNRLILSVMRKRNAKMDNEMELKCMIKRSLWT